MSSAAVKIRDSRDEAGNISFVESDSRDQAKDASSVEISEETHLKRMLSRVDNHISSESFSREFSEAQCSAQKAIVLSIEKLLTSQESFLSNDLPQEVRHLPECIGYSRMRASLFAGLMVIRDGVRKGIEREGEPSPARTALAQYSLELSRISSDSLEAKALMKLCFMTNKEICFLCQGRFEECLPKTSGRELVRFAEEISYWVMQEVWAQNS